MSRQRKPVRRQVFVFTPDEKRAAACVVGAFLLGLGTMYYRARNPRPPAPSSAAEQREAKKAASRTRASKAVTQAVSTPAAPRRDRDDEE